MGPKRRDSPVREHTARHLHLLLMRTLTAVRLNSHDFTDLFNVSTQKHRCLAQNLSVSFRSFNNAALNIPLSFETYP